MATNIAGEIFPFVMISECTLVVAIMFCCIKFNYCRVNCLRRSLNVGKRSCKRHLIGHGKGILIILVDFGWDEYVTFWSQSVLNTKVKCVLDSLEELSRLYICYLNVIETAEITRTSKIMSVDKI